MRKLLTIEKGSPSKDIRDLLKSNVIGTPNQSLVYRQIRAADKLQSLTKVYFLSVKVGGKALGACCFIPRAIRVDKRLVSSFYIRYFSFRDSLRTSGESLRRLSNKNSKLRDEINDCLNGEGLDIKSPLCYAYVDESNLRSKSIIDSFGFKKVGAFNVKFISRFFPKNDSQVEQVESDNLSEFRSRIGEEYADHSFVCLDNIGFENGAYVYRSSGKIVGGIQTYLEEWEVSEIPGSNFLLDVMSHTPLLRKIFSRNFKFLSVEGFFCDDGFEQVIEPLIETALAKGKRNTAVACADRDSLFYKRLSNISEGAIRYMTKEKEIALVARGEEADLTYLRNKSIYVSSFDNM